jgi:hypothetical protein
VLEPELHVGRAAPNALRLEGRYISAQHATLRWSGGRWELRDLGSRNGTFVDGARLKPSQDYPLRRGAIVAFGVLEQRWQVIDDSAPCAMAVPLDAGDPVIQDHELIALPSSEDPRATIYRSADGEWLLETPSSSSPISNLETFELHGRAWRFCCVENVRTTLIAGQPFEVEVERLAITFDVSRDEEFVHIRVSDGHKALDLGARAHNHLLLTLARQRLDDEREGFAEGARGWVHREDLRRDPAQLAVEIFRLRRQFTEAGVLDGANIVENRRGARQIRVGTGRIAINRL